ncbi:MAG TPA: TonB-dependent receptor [Nevskiaceae bacterium]|nr:TonB-dependent receptor [Nevskiaceae bacterium]
MSNTLHSIWALTACLAAAPALAQEPAVETPAEVTEAVETVAVDGPTEAAAEAAPEDAASRSALLEEIVVTAQKREENLSDVPLSIQAFTPESLASRGIDSQIGLSRAVPSLDVGSQAGYATIFLRGIGTEAFLTADPSIASYVDGVYFPFSPTFVQSFSGVERVEVLKGPQGTLFGRNAVGGAISVTNYAPDFENRVTHVDFTAGRYDLLKPRVYVNVPITDNLATNLAAYYSRSNYYLDGETGGKPLRRQYDEGVRAKLRWAPIEDLDVNLGWTRTRNQGNGPIGQNLNPSPLGEALLIQPPEDKRSVYVDEHLYGVAETKVVNGQVNYYAPWVDVKLLASRQKDSLLYNYDFDGSTQPYVSFDVPGHPANIEQQELQLISNESMPWSDWLDITGGVFLFRNIQGFDPVEVTVANFDPTDVNSVQQIFGVVLPDAVNDQFTAIFGPGGSLEALAGGVLPDARAYRARAQAQVETNSAGYYLQTTMRFTDWMALTLGGRFQEERRSVYRSTVTVVAGETDVGDVLIDGPLIVWETARDAETGETVPNNHTTRGFQPKVSVDFHPFGDDTLLFASWQEAKKAHAYNAFAVYLPPQYIRPEETTAYEVGIRTTLFDGAMRLNLAAFEYKIRNLQTQYVSLLSGGALAFENAPHAKSRGIDFDLVTEIFPSVVSGLALSLNGAYIDAKFGSYPNAAGYSPSTGLFSPDNDFSGNRQTRTPKYSGTVALTKLWATDNHEFEVGADYYYNDGFYYSASNDPNYEQKDYTLLGGFVRWQYVPWNFDIRAFGTNLTDEFYTQGVISTDFGGVFTVAPPRQYGVTVSWKF